ncbi:hypothetical protein E4U56_005601 [Claviceps arundinis]|uniref:Uncharacterized protein n=1 Tax=Claviceps arundinis TaxID=1623583 RepID=A0A9P7SR47_9HYPO|nr:hypothetical protein E4U56_005601 [Claviceps arundinis]
MTSDAVQFKVAYSFAFGGFMRMDELTHSALEEQSTNSNRTRLTIRCLTISPRRDSLQLFLPRSKTGKTNRSVTIIMVTTGDLDCLVQKALRDTVRHLIVSLIRLKTGLNSSRAE